MNNQYYALRFRSTDDLHHKGDIQYGGAEALYIGQTPECQVRIPGHPDYADTCYAVIVSNPTGDGWILVRQESEALIRVNGEDLGIARVLHSGDTLQTDHTIMQWSIEKGQQPTTIYVRQKASWPLRITLGAILLILAVMIGWHFQKEEKVQKLFRHEIQSIYRIEADTLQVFSSEGMVEELVCEHPYVGTCFITEDGYLVTARHCVEFWLGMEDALRSNPDSITSPFARWAVMAEEDEGLRLVVRLTITDRKGEKKWYVSSEDFTIDRSHDGIYEKGDREHAYLWRSVISRYEKKDCELGDVAVMRWSEKGTIQLTDAARRLEQTEQVYCFGYPQSESRQEGHFTILEGSVFHEAKSPEYWFICNLDCTPGFSGGPVMVKNPHKQVAGLVSRSAEGRTLVVPVHRIHQLIALTKK